MIKAGAVGTEITGDDPAFLADPAGEEGRLPPGAAHASSTRSPGSGASVSTTNADAWSCTANQPSSHPGSDVGFPPGNEDALRMDATDASGSSPASRSRAVTCSTVVRQVFTRRVSGPCSPRASAAGSTSSGGRSFRSSATAHGVIPVRRLIA